MNMTEIIECVRSLDERNRKPGCVKQGQKGFNFQHDTKGRFSTKKNSKSWSNSAEYYGADKKDCVGGKFKTKGTNHKYWAKQKCGVDGSGKKHKYVCSTGKEVQEEEVTTPRQKKRRIVVRVKRARAVQEREKTGIEKREDILPGSHELTKLSRGLFEGADVQMSLDEFIVNIGKVYRSLGHQERVRFEKGVQGFGLVAVESIEDMCQGRGMKTLSNWLKLQNNIELSKKGELFKKEKQE
tara:strand:- start:321 stop:1040 length:720 start_codon:yes stop_codon:yes gene_type:complete